jgi:hypothetical protein
MLFTGSAGMIILFLVEKKILKYYTTGKMTCWSFGDHKIFKTEDHIHVALKPPAWVLSSAVLGGGYAKADHIVN